MLKTGDLFNLKESSNNDNKNEIITGCCLKKHRCQRADFLTNGPT